MAICRARANAPRAAPPASRFPCGGARAPSSSADPRSSRSSSRASEGRSAPSRTRRRCTRRVSPRSLSLLLLSCCVCVPGVLAAGESVKRCFQNGNQWDDVFVGARAERARRALTVGRVARRSGVRRVLAEIGPSSSREATRESARAFREGIEELGTTFIKLGQLLSSRPDLLPDIYITELEQLVDSLPPVPFAEIEAVIREDFGEGVFVSLDPE